MLYNLPCEIEVGELGLGRLRLGHTLPCAYRNNAAVPVLDEHTAVHADILAADLVIPGHIHLENAEILLGLEQFKGIRGK